ncbi:transcriptional regulator with XRE-family HTH domain [Catenulispora sp. MAP5-51]|uniref:helix-turn-helix domain-containing protein n=1 Tax=Catenulispora sp. MAP5-51 TaxID=3156298 RepID=UPI003511D090
MDDDGDEFGAWLGRQLRRKGMSQADLADELGVTRAAVSAWVTGRAEPRPDKMRALAAVFEVEPSAVFNMEEEPTPLSELAWYHRPAHADGGRELGNPAAFAFEASLATLARETAQNSLDEQVDGTQPVRLRYVIHEISGERLIRFRRALRWDTLDDHYETASRSDNKVGRALAEALRGMRESGRLLLLRVDDYNASGLTGDDFEDGRFAAVVRRQLDSRKVTESAGGSFGLGKATLWATSRLGLVLINSTLSVPHQGRRERRVVGRLELPWRRLHDGTAYAGPAWLGEPDPTMGDVTRSWWADEQTVTELYLDREGADPGTSFLIVGVDDAILSTSEPTNGEDPESDQSRRAVLRAIHEELRDRIASNFWAAMVSGKRAPALLEASVTTLRDGAVVVAEERVNPHVAEPARARALKAFYDGETSHEIGSPEDVAQTTVQLTVSARKDAVAGDRNPLPHEAILLVTPSSAEEAGRDRVACMRGNRMVVTDRLIGDSRGINHYTGVLLSGEATLADTVDARAADAFLRTAEPPEHDAWKKTGDLTTTYARGAATNLASFLRGITPAFQSLTRAQELPAEDGPPLLNELLRLDTPKAPSSPQYPTVKRVSGGVDGGGAWNIEVEIKLPKSDTPWIVSPVLKFVTRSGPDLTADWHQLEPALNCVLTEDGDLRCGNGAIAVFRGISEVTSHPVNAHLTVATVELNRAKERARA